MPEVFERLWAILDPSVRHPSSVCRHEAMYIRAREVAAVLLPVLRSARLHPCQDHPRSLFSFGFRRLPSERLDRVVAVKDEELTSWALEPRVETGFSSGCLAGAGAATTAEGDDQQSQRAGDPRAQSASHKEKV